MTLHSGICVIIPAWNAEATIVRAVTSALAQPQVAEVLVVDDASTDGTAQSATDADDGSGRLRVLCQPRNIGPAAARNVAIDASTAPLLAILDSDDFLLPGRFAPLLATPGWDAIADNLAFVPEDQVAALAPATLDHGTASPRRLSLAEFVLGNISVAGQPRAELGFVKPVIRRSFLAAHGLRYDESLRLGEDYALYARILARGGAFLTVARCGYVAVERASSLSGCHRGVDLANLAASDLALLGEDGLDDSARRAIRRHRDQTAAKARHRRFLDMRRAQGLPAALAQALLRPHQVPPLAFAIARDKWRDRHPGAPKPAQVRYLFA
ncbi:glycosyltransferase family 2 protein [Polymorphobacter fuscus]|uniref:Glycosyltransferase n=2 Tax=Sandarakinorhabdus fusca TaxID=1439888 RepID=A0A7C9KYQ8_9SPHN|nr:glycosyltransferase family 2 protein [Polymorphobacter fuscus]KAB7648046.1 glycosyltransferase family 2 protein [Polymorphobacter fuscus]MQT17248.1 glycosyltransferase [Polymorphobacter fuscus]